MIKVVLSSLTDKQTQTDKHTLQGSRNAWNARQIAGNMPVSLWCDVYIVGNISLWKPARSSVDRCTPGCFTYTPGVAGEMSVALRLLTTVRSEAIHLNHSNPDTNWTK
jgi:hypothetical protein